MRKLNALAIVFVLLISTVNSPILFSSISLADEQPASGSTPETTSGGSATTASSGTGSSGSTETTTTQPTTTATEQTTTETQVTKIPAELSVCPAPQQQPACGENQGLITNFDDKGCVTGYECKETQRVEVGQIAVCPEVPPSTLTCQTNEQLNKITDDKGCVVGYNCVSTASQPSIAPTAGGGGVPAPIACPQIKEKPKCDGNTVPIFDKGCLISFSCVPQGCRQETDSSGFVRVVCKQEKSCIADEQQKELVSNCKSQGGNPVPFQDPSGCTFYDCRFDDRGIKPNPLSGHQSCPTHEEVERDTKQCEASGLIPGIVFEGGCKIVRCSKEITKEERSCRYVPGPERIKIENDCSTRGLSAISATDNNGCQYFRCGDTSQATCQRDVPPEAYKSCDSRGGEMVVKNDNQGCIVFSQCVAQGDEKNIQVSQVKEVPDATVLLSLALKLEQLKIELQKLSTESKEIAKYYASTGSLDEERYNRVSSMFDAAASRIDEIKTKIRDNVDDITADDMVEIKHDIKYIKEVTLKDILYLMLSNSDDVKETLESSRKISTKSSLEEIAQNAKDCGTDGYCFDRAIRSCKPVTFQPEGRNGPLVSITGLQDKNCVLHISMQSSSMVPPGYSKDNFFMDCPIADYALGVGGPEDIIPTCEGPMAKFAKQFGGAAEISGGDDAFQEIIEKEGGPGGCNTERECATYCVDNYDECREWVKEHPAVGPMPSREELRQFASGKQEIRQGPSQQATRFSGPGGCNGPQECDKFCRSNPDECLRWCDENPDVCPKEKLESPRQASTQVGSESQGFGSSSQGGKCPDGICDEFEKSNPAACPQDCGGSATKQPISIAQPSSAQACVGCLNNGICDIGECSECIDCLKGTRSITGEIIRAGGWNE